MAGLFDPNYIKEGPGVPENGDKRSAFAVYIDIVYRKFWSIGKISLLHSLFSLPAFVVCLFVFAPLFMKGSTTDGDLAKRLFCSFLLCSAQLVTAGPLHAGTIYLFRNYAREENAFIWTDFIKGIRQNAGRATAVSLINLVLLGLIGFVFNFYLRAGEQLGVMGTVCTALLLILLLFFASMQLYIFPMMVTVDLTVKQLYGNALRFAIGRLIPNLAVLTAIVGIELLMFWNLMMGMVLMTVIGYGLILFSVTFYAYRAIDQYVVPKNDAADDEKNRP